MWVAGGARGFMSVGEVVVDAGVRFWRWRWGWGCGM